MANDNIGAVLLECSVMPPYGKKAYDVSNVPVYDFNTMINFICSTVVKKKFKGLY